MASCDLLVVEASLDGCLVPYSRRRTEGALLAESGKVVCAGARVYYEVVRSVDGLRTVLGWVADQNRRKKSTDLGHGTEKSPTSIRYIHFNGHGDAESLSLPRSEANQISASASELASAFTESDLKGVRAVFFSSCKTGRSKELAEVMLRGTSGLQAVIGFPENADDDVSALAAQLLYFQVLNTRKSNAIEDSVRRVNDALVLLGASPKRLLTCWILEDGKLRGPCPWWHKTVKVNAGDRERRSYLLRLVKLFPRGGKVGAANLKSARPIIQVLLDGI